jgi:hypothetical protein
MTAAALAKPVEITLDLEIERMAHNLAKKHELVRDGVIWCWSCSTLRALMPSLHCHRCLAEHHRRKGNLAPQCINREQTPADVIACGGVQKLTDDEWAPEPDEEFQYE